MGGAAGKVVGRGVEERLPEGGEGGELGIALEKLREPVLELALELRRPVDVEFEIGFQRQVRREIARTDRDCAAIFDLDIDQLLDKRHVDPLCAANPAANPDAPDQLGRRAFGGVDRGMDLEEIVVNRDRAPNGAFLPGPVRPGPARVMLVVTPHLDQCLGMENHPHPVLDLDPVLDDRMHVVGIQQSTFGEVRRFLDRHLDRDRGLDLGSPAGIGGCRGEELRDMLVRFRRPRFPLSVDPEPGTVIAVEVEPRQAIEIAFVKHPEARLHRHLDLGSGGQNALGKPEKPGELPAVFGGNVVVGNIAIGGHNRRGTPCSPVPFVR